MTVRIRGDAKTRRVWVNGEELRPPSRPEYSPSGFDWGYTGAGPAELALAILRLFNCETIARVCHQDFMARCVATWQGDFEVELPDGVFFYSAPEVGALAAGFGGGPQITYPLAEPERYLSGFKIRGDGK